MAGWFGKGKAKGKGYYQNGHNQIAPFAPPVFQPTTGPPATTSPLGAFMQQTSGAINDIAAFGQFMQFSQQMANMQNGGPTANTNSNANAAKQGSTLAPAVDATASADSGDTLATQAKQVIYELKELQKELKPKTDEPPKANTDGTTQDSGLKRSVQQALDSNEDFKKVKLDISSLKEGQTSMASQVEKLQESQVAMSAKIGDCTITNNR